MIKNKQLAQLPPEVIYKNPDNPRLIFREEDLDILINSIKQVGIQVPLSVYRKGSTNKYILIDGERRWRCSMKLGLQQVPVIIEPEPTPLENLLMMFNIHNVRVQWDLMALALKIKKVNDLFYNDQKRTLSKSELAELTGVSLATIGRCEELLSLPKKYQDIIWAELEKPRAEQKYTEDLFLEIRRSIKTIENYTPEITDEYSSNKLLNLFFKKYESNTVKNRVEFRNISKIARGERVGIPKERVITAIKDFIEIPQRTIAEVYENTVANAYSERTYEKKIMDVIDLLRNTDINELDADIVKLLHTLYKMLQDLKNEEKL